MALNIISMPAHPTNQWYRNGQKIEYIVIHYVGAVSTAINNGNYYGNTPNIGASAHYFTDQYNIVASVPLNMSAGHCGVDYSGGRALFWGKCRNKNSIGIEMCCKIDKNGNWYIEPETINKTVELTRELMKRFNIPASHVVRHYDVCWKQCPEPFVRNPALWENFKKRIAQQEDDDMTTEEVKKIVSETVGEILAGVNTKPSQWAEDEMGENLKDAAGITDGTRPRGYTRREETAAMVYRLRQELKDKGVLE